MVSRGETAESELRGRNRRAPGGDRCWIGTARSDAARRTRQQNVHRVLPASVHTRSPQPENSAGVPTTNWSTMISRATFGAGQSKHPQSPAVLPIQLVLWRAAKLL